MFELNILSMNDRVWLHSLEVCIHRFASKEEEPELISKLYDFLKGAIQRELQSEEIDEIQGLIFYLQKN